MASLGETLRECRLARGMTLEQAESATRIRARLLQALEDGTYDLLPAPGYVRGYISSYARFLELDPRPLLSLYEAETGLRRSPGLNLPQIDEAVPRTGEQHTLSPATARTVVASVAAIALIVWGITTWSSKADTSQPEPIPVTGVASTGPSPADGTRPLSRESTGESSSDRQGALRGRPFEVTVRISETGASWVRVDIDGKKAYEGTLTGGQSKSFQTVEVAVVRIGKPSSVTILRDGRPVAIPEGDTPTVRLEAVTP